MSTDDPKGERGDDPDSWLGLSRKSGGGPLEGGGWFRDCRNAAIILTGWPFGRRGEIGRAAEADSRRAFVLVGLALGLAAALFAWLADLLGLQAFGAAVFAAVTLATLSHARAEGAAAAAAANLAGAEEGSDARFAVVAAAVGAVLLARIAGLAALAPLTAMLAALLAAQVLSTATMALATLPGGDGDADPLFDAQRDNPRSDRGGNVALWISAAAALLLAILFLGLWTALLAAAVSLIVGALVFVSADLFGMPRDRNLLHTLRIKSELAVIVTVVAVS
ncbi:MAG: hypothetical protein OXM58_14315 [Rhodospirillaceae bacterium]|nr:hypothetical protein [Rhodospirillaceae bacterium]MDE0619178.1 hypothetical protein [Rhodospirillaceae bacterium]